MSKFLVRIVFYAGILYGASLLTTSVRFEDGVSFVVVLLVLFFVNLLIRPIFLAIALPFNIFTLGIVSVFVNMLTIIIAKAIVHGAVIDGFWPLAIVAVLIMAVDSIQRKASRGKFADEN